MNARTTSTEAADADLLAASRSGEVEAFGRLVERYQNLVCAIAYSRTGDRLLSEDIGQETFLAAWGKIDTVREPDKLRSWLCGIARNLSSKAVRARKRERVSDAESIDANPSSDPDPLQTMLPRRSRGTDRGIPFDRGRETPGNHHRCGRRAD